MFGVESNKRVCNGPGHITARPDQSTRYQRSLPSPPSIPPRQGSHPLAPCAAVRRRGGGGAMTTRRPSAGAPFGAGRGRAGAGGRGQGGAGRVLGRSDMEVRVEAGTGDSSGVGRLLEVGGFVPIRIDSHADAPAPAPAPGPAPTPAGAPAPAPDSNDRTWSPHGCSRQHHPLPRTPIHPHSHPPTSYPRSMRSREVWNTHTCASMPTSMTWRGVGGGQQARGVGTGSRHAEYGGGHTGSNANSRKRVTPANLVPCTPHGVYDTRADTPRALISPPGTPTRVPRAPMPRGPESHAPA